jgi:LysM repeat protein
MSTLIMGSTEDAATDRYLIIDGVKHEILDDASLAAASLTPPAKAPVAITAFASLPWGAPIAKDGSLFVNRTTGLKQILFAGHAYSIDAATAADVDFGKWFTATAGTLSSESVGGLETGITIKSIVADEGGQHYWLNAAGKQLISNGQNVVAAAPVIPAALLNRIPNVGEPITAPFFASAPASKAVFLIRDLNRRPTISATDRAKFSSILATPAVVTLNNSAMAQIAPAPTLLGPGSLLKTKKSDALYFIDASDHAYRFANSSHAKLFTSAKPKIIAKNLLAGYSTKNSIGGFRVKCDGVEYFAIDGKLHTVLADYALQYPGKVFTLDSLTCATLAKSAVSVGRFIVEGKASGEKYYLIQGKKKRLVATKKQYLLLRGTTPTAVPVSKYFASLLPTGPALAASVKTVLTAPTDQPSSSPSASPSASPPAVTNPPVTPSTTPTTPKAQTTYKIKSGDSLSSIARRYSVTLAALAAANHITNVNRISVGQVLVIP